MRKKEFVNLRIRTLINKKNKNLNTKDKYWTYIYIIMVIVVILEIIMITYVVDMKETVGEVYSAAITGIVVVLGVTWITQFHNQIMNIDSYNAEIDKEIYVLGEKFYLKGLLESDNREYYEENILEKLNRIELNNNKKR